MNGEFADEWAGRVRADWERIKRNRPEQFRDAVAKGKGMLTTGMFITTSGGRVVLTTRQILHQGNEIEVTTLDIRPCNFGPCAFGITDVFNEYINKTSERAKQETLIATPSLLRKTSREMLWAIRLVDLSIAYDKSGGIGGPIDALEIYPAGGVHWFQRKNECPESQD